ncbi:MAG: dipeptidase [Proteobacteria bacterium]|nr:dipeptidase [Pseudomonadota bacterium]
MNLKGLLVLLPLLLTPVIAGAEEVDLAVTAGLLAQQALIVDTHIDVPYRLFDDWADVTQSTEDGDFDYHRARSGGLNIPFMSIYTPAEAEEEGTSYALANQLIDSVEALVGRAPGKFVIVKTTDDAKQAMENGLIGLAMGMENGSPIDGKLENLAFFHDRGISYITLAHSLSNHISDSSYDEERKWHGLSPFGKEVVAEMNRLGIMVDISHVTDEAFYQVLAISKTPVIASHSSPRHFTPDWERNMSDEMIKALAKNGGVIQINFGSSFVNKEARDWRETMVELRDIYLEANGLDKHDDESEQFEEDYRLEHPYPYATLDDLVANFEHVIGLVGAEHVGIGSDFDGVGDSLPAGMKDVSYYPALIEALLKREYTVDVIQAIMGGNLMRVWSEVEDHAAVR